MEIETTIAHASSTRKEEEKRRESDERVRDSTPEIDAEERLVERRFSLLERTEEDSARLFRRHFAGSDVRYTP